MYWSVGDPKTCPDNGKSCQPWKMSGTVEKHALISNLSLKAETPIVVILLLILRRFTGENSSNLIPRPPDFLLDYLESHPGNTSQSQ